MLQIIVRKLFREFKLSLSIFQLSRSRVYEKNPRVLIVQAYAFGDALHERNDDSLFKLGRAMFRVDMNDYNYCTIELNIIRSMTSVFFN